MEITSFEFWQALINIIIIDLVLAGDNAIVIGLAARRLPKEKQKKVILWGTAGAIILRIIATMVVVWLLKIPGLLLVGGILLIWIAYNLMVDDKEHDIKAEKNMWGAIQTIIIADTVMSLDNVLAIAGAAHGSYLLVVIGLLISVPIIIWGSTVFLKVMERYPWVLYIGAGVLAFTAAKMMVGEPFIGPLFAGQAWLSYAFYAIVTIGVVAFGIWQNRKKEDGTSKPKQEPNTT